MGPNGAVKLFEDRLFLGELNRFVGSGGEVLMKADRSASEDRMDVGDRLMGIGATHYIESLDRPPGPGALHATTLESDFQVKSALRAIQVVSKEETDDGFEFQFSPFAPEDFSQTLEELSEGAVQISASEIPEGTIVLSFVDAGPTYTLQSADGSPGLNWHAATKGDRHWNVGIANESDFWVASFPSDEVGLLRQMPHTMTVGSIRFGLSLLPGSRTTIELEPVSCTGPSGQTTEHDFCLDGTASGTGDIDTPFPIGVQTQIKFRPGR